MPELDLTFSQIIVVAVLSGGVAGGLVSGVIKLVGEALNRRHERDARVLGERRDIYLRALQFVSEARTSLDELILKGPAAAPIRVRGDDVNDLIRQLTAFGSGKIQNLVRDLLKSVAECTLAVQEHAQARSQQVESEVVFKLWGRVQELREKCANLAVRIEREINRELTS